MDDVCGRAVRWGFVLLLGLVTVSMGSFFATVYGQEEGGGVRQGEGERAAQLPLPERGGAAQAEGETPQTQEQREQAERAARQAQERNQGAEREAREAQERAAAAQAKPERETRRFVSAEAAHLFEQAQQLEREGKMDAAADLKKKYEKIEADARASREQEQARKAQGGGEGQAQAVRESDLRGEIAALRQDVKKLQDQVAELTALVRKLLPAQ